MRVPRLTGPTLLDTLAGARRRDDSTDLTAVDGLGGPSNDFGLGGPVFVKTTHAFEQKRLGACKDHTSLRYVVGVETELAFI